MRSIKNFVIEAKVTHKEKEGDLILLEKFDNQNKVIQYHKIESVPDIYKDIADKGDMLLVHFNIIAYSLGDGSSKIMGKFHLRDDFYYVPLDIAHAIIKKDGNIIPLGDWNIVIPIKESTEKILSSGIILPDLRKDTEIKEKMMKGYIKISNNKEVAVGDKVLLNKYSDYEVEFPDGKKYWLVRDLNLLAVIE